MVIPVAMATTNRDLSKPADDVSPPSALLTWEAIRMRNDPSWSQLEAQLSEPLSTPVIELWAVRHGETTTNAQGLVTGTSDPPLTAEGHKQARDAGDQLSGHDFEMAWYSPLRRSRETLSDIFEANVRARSVLEDDRIRERRLGSLELSPARPIEQFAKGDLSFAPPGGESYEEVTRRCLSFLIDLAAMAVALDRPTKVLICSHVGPMRILAGILDRIDDPREVLGLRFSNSSPRKFDITQLDFPLFLQSFRK
jgi:broad specificity phosphatase PhoE